MSHLDKTGNKLGYRAVPGKKDTGVEQVVENETKVVLDRHNKTAEKHECNEFPHEGEPITQGQIVVYHTYKCIKDGNEIKRRLRIHYRRVGGNYTRMQKTPVVEFINGKQTSK
jgi:hypothetical protein